MFEQRTIEATLEHTSKFSYHLESTLQELPLETRTGVVLAVQELLVNIVKHAYAGEPGEIEFTLRVTGAQLTITVLDQGQNTFSASTLVATPDALALPEGGLGMFIIHQTFDEVTYTRLSERNQWQLVKQV